MKKYILIIAVLILAQIITFSLLSCGNAGAPAPAAPSPAAEKAAEPTPIRPVAALPPATSPPDTASKPAEKPAVTTSVAPATTSPALKPSVPAPDLPDIKPYLVDGKAAVTVDTSGTDYKKFLIKAGVANTGRATAGDVTVLLYNGNTKIYSWNVGQLKSGENKVLQTTVEEILKQSQIFAGQYSLNINCALSGGGKESEENNNRSESCQVMLAAPPVAEEAPQTTTGKLIQDAVKNTTWYTEKNKAELITIMKEVLKDANISWNIINIEIFPAEKFNELYANTLGTTDAMKQQLKQSLAAYKLPGIAFIWGTPTDLHIAAKEGTIVQLLPALLSRIGALTYGQISIGAYNANKLNSSLLASSLMEAYGLRVMREKHGFSGLINMSASLNRVQYPDLKGTGAASVIVRRMWAMAAEEGYPNGDIPSAKILKNYFNLTSKSDPTALLTELDKKAELLDMGVIESIIRWRLVNKNLTMLPGDVAEKTGAPSWDMVISYQEFVAFPW